MQIGIFAKTFVRPKFEEVFEAVHRSGLKSVQFNFACAGLPSMPEIVPADLLDGIQKTAGEQGIAIAAISGTFNMIHPDGRVRLDGLRGLRVVCAAAHALGVPVVTLCTGTRDAKDMWRRHPDNDSREAWSDLCESVTAALHLAEPFGVILGVEPEVGNVIDSAAKARRLLDQFASPRLKIVFDAANLFHPGELARQREILGQAFDLLAADIVLAHAKDLSADGGPGDQPAGKGRLDYPYYLQRLRQSGFGGPLILHGLSEPEVAGCIGFLRRELARLPPM